MDNLADAVLDYFWFLEFSDEDDADPDTTCNLLEHLCSKIETEFTRDEKQALRCAASRRLAWYLQEPDEHGFTPRKLSTPDKKEFLDWIIAGQFSGPDL